MLAVMDDFLKQAPKRPALTRVLEKGNNRSQKVVAHLARHFELAVAQDAPELSGICTIVAGPCTVVSNPGLTNPISWICCRGARRDRLRNISVQNRDRMIDCALRQEIRHFVVCHARGCLALCSHTCRKTDDKNCSDRQDREGEHQGDSFSFISCSVCSRHSDALINRTRVENVRAELILLETSFFFEIMDRRRNVLGPLTTRGFRIR